MRSHPPSKALRDQSGTAAAEMVLVAPLILLLIFGAAEVGNLFYGHHIVSKAVRDGARFAARLPFSDYDMAACSLSNAAQSNTKRLVRTTQLATAGAPGILPGWDEPDEASTVTVTVTCDASGSYLGVYRTNGNVAATVTVRASVPYTTLMGGFPFDSSGWRLTAESEAAVTGV